MALNIAVATLFFILIALAWSISSAPADPWAQERYARDCYIPDWGDYDAPPGTDYSAAVCELKSVKP